ncbi:hypothetical protein A3K01_03760 [candidate division WWE3 bacterium RIFOXYD1_FULL_43_17]|uniref:Uncharacterized protein n=1 Tax=candidate division WWE3 bacterium RIFOXYD1_FULL_43_17 TaxID=1802652 RepID=A0A1F4XCE5_UNCKA|nr:MAG: hypothetical protein A3K01_03760 [candidate division WWE3 bacterium RIFOXYD1_FULL_43_17]
MKKVKLIGGVCLLTIALASFLIINNPGYHLVHCSCSFEFLVGRNRIDCAVICNSDEITPLTKRQELINRLLFTKMIAKLYIVEK